MNPELKQYVFCPPDTDSESHEETTLIPTSMCQKCKIECPLNPNKPEEIVAENN